MITTPVKTPPNTSTKPPKSSKKSQKSPKSSNSPLSKLKKILEILLIILPSALFFSYHPVISLGDTASMHIELSLPLLLLALISFLSLPLLPHTIKSTPKKLLLAFLIIPCYTIISLIWSNNPLRTFLSAGVLTCLSLTILTLPSIIKSSPTFKKRTLTLFLATATLVSIFAWLQSFLDILGVPRNLTLLCEGCTYQSFGFPHPNAFAIEPQFLGNLLLAPVFLSYYSLLKNKSQKNQPLRFLLALFLTTTLFFTFSRGAIYAFLLALTILLLYTTIKKRPTPILLPIIILSFLLSLLSQGALAQLSPTTDTFLTGITKSLHHLTLGKLDLRDHNNENSNNNDNNEQESIHESPSEGATKGQLAPTTILGSIFLRENTIGKPPVTTGGLTGAQNSSGSELAFSGNRSEPISLSTPRSELPFLAAPSKFSGYVPESTEVRTSLTKRALTLWAASPKTLLLGTALGGAGPTLYAAYPDLGTEKQIVQNEYASLLLEFGLLGIVVVLTSLILLLTTLRLTDPIQKQWLFTLLLAYALTLFFFSGLPNALHIYLLPAYAFLLSKHHLLVH